MEANQGFRIPSLDELDIKILELMLKLNHSKDLGSYSIVGILFPEIKNLQDKILKRNTIKAKLIKMINNNLVNATADKNGNKEMIATFFPSDKVSIKHIKLGKSRIKCIMFDLDRKVLISYDTKGIKNIYK